jgi:hypothetical protein
MNTKTIVWVGVFAGAGYVAYIVLFQKKMFAKAIVNSGNYSKGVDSLLEFDKSFLKPWANASKSGNPTFIFNGKEYNTNGGRAKK